MQLKKGIRILWHFLREQRFYMLLFLLFIVLFTVVFSLYDLALEAIWYGALLCFVSTMFLQIIRFIQYYWKHCHRQALLPHITFSYDALPAPSTLIEQDMQEMVYTLGKTYHDVMTAWQAQQKESLDYYSAWVHQIKTPISGMKMMLQSEDTEENRILLAELFQIEQYTEMALTYLRLDSHSTDFVFQEYDLNTIIRQAIQKYAAQFVMHKVKLVYEPVSITVLTDEKWLLFIIEQLLSNAIKYTKQGCVTITVTPEKVLRIADTGIGIASEDLPRIFEKGFTGYNGRADKKSTGLGLYLCQQAAEKISVSLSVVSEVGKGSVFSVHLYIPPLIVE